MGLGGVVLAGVGIIMVVLVANNRWDSTWNAMLGSGGASQIPGGAPPSSISYTPNGENGGNYTA